MITVQPCNYLWSVGLDSLVQDRTVLPGTVLVMSRKLDVNSTSYVLVIIVSSYV